MSKEIKTIELSARKTQLAISCLICERGIPVYDLNVSTPQICEECRSRLKDILYGESEGAE